MICSKCCHWNVPEVKVRMTPTFYHSPIFDDYDSLASQKPFSCNATYHSTVFDGAHQHKKIKQAINTACCCKKGNVERVKSARAPQKNDVRAKSMGI